VANSFTIHQRQAINFKDLPIELREAKKYQWEIYSFDRIKANAKSESIKTINKDESVSLVTKEIKTYTIADHIKESRTDTQALYEELSEWLLTLDQRLDEDPKKVYIGYKIGNQIVVDIKPRKSKIVFECLRVEPKDMKDPENKLKYMEKSMQHYNKHVSQMEITSSDDITYALMLTKQIINKFFS
jgi:predicted transport protein